MSAMAAPSAAPPYAVTAWVDRTRLFIEFPSIHGPLVLDYPRTVEGFMAALCALGDRNMQLSGNEVYHPPKSPAWLQDRHGATQDVRDKAAALLRKKGIIP